MRKPDKENFAEAWLVKMPDTDQGCVAQWIVKGDFHPHWNHWIVSVVHLRDYEGQPYPATKDFPRATHEYLILAVDPSKANNLDPDNLKFNYLVPIDLQFQGMLPDDATAARVLEDMIDDIVSMKMSPDSDFRHKWYLWFNDKIKAINENNGSNAH